MNTLLQLFAPQPHIEPLPGSKAEISATFKGWQTRILLSTMLGYILFYFVRKNLSIAMPVMGKELGITKSDLGLFLTLHGLIYGVSRFANGWLADRTNARMLMTTGLILCALMNIGFGMSSTVIMLGVFWMLNGWVQGMGFPPCARLMTHWFEPRELATKQSIWNTSHSIGAGLVVVLCGYLAPVNWRLCFFVPAGLALAGSLVLWMTLRDTPPSIGLPEVAGTEGSAPEHESNASHAAFLKDAVFGNRYIWLLALANFFVYIVRYGVLDWGPTFLSEAKHIKLEHAGWMVAAFEISGVVGMLVAGVATDRIFGGRGARTCFFFMAGAGLAMLAFWKLNSQSWVTNTALLCIAGFFIYGPQALIGIAVANLATKRGAATAAGFTGIFGYASTLFSGWGVGKLVDLHGWDAGLLGIVIASALGTIIFAAAWPGKANGYGKAAVAVLALTTVGSATGTEIVSHRGFSAKAPENTAAAFKMAWEAGTDACELDLYLTRDGKIIVIHDKDTARTTGVKKVVAESTLEELRALDAGFWKGEQWKGERLPTLEEALATMPRGDKRFFLEIKCGPEIVPAMAAALEPWRDRARQIAIISFNQSSCAAAKKAMPWISCYLLAGSKDKNKKPQTLDQVIKLANSGGLDGLDLGLDWPWSAEMVAQVRAAGLKVFAWTANTPADIKRLAAVGVDGITTDDPILARELLGK